MIEKINKLVKASGFRFWKKLEEEFGYSRTSKGALKQRVQRYIKFLNEFLKPLGYELTIKKL